MAFVTRAVSLCMALMCHTPPAWALSCDDTWIAQIQTPTDPNADTIDARYFMSRVRTLREWSKDGRSIFHGEVYRLTDKPFMHEAEVALLSDLPDEATRSQTEHMGTVTYSYVTAVGLRGLVYTEGRVKPLETENIHLKFVSTGPYFGSLRTGENRIVFLTQSYGMPQIIVSICDNFRGTISVAEFRALTQCASDPECGRAGGSD